MKKEDDDKVIFVNGMHPEINLRRDSTPTYKQGRLIAQQRIRLPYVLSYDLQKTISILEKRNKRELAPWQQCPWLQGELILLLGNDQTTVLNEYKLTYSAEKGLQYTKEDR